MEFVVAALFVTASLVLLARIAFPRHGPTAEDLLSRTDLAWPRGIQEEEPARWHVERLHPRTRP